MHCVAVITTLVYSSCSTTFLNTNQCLDPTQIVFTLYTFLSQSQLSFGDEVQSDMSDTTFGLKDVC